ncbi:uncharacterized protein MONBRDRAFT_27915 [Monosiga brevicollis MX1]|uniref:EF-hand domain-containing protein n=1 Tax=Monosiga brevicollis TaxID=81824 RepID=A9V6E5_MONBE|nr:uncharacterized protein MONBRDRAFT_27915 [Monosiga brevicollis MX1]EDQ86795.1 predicted protein [Monosiga brevicollis MX1]|eukprot:XP_001748340.1 hypothetical protein [Monosiga brevicollis MX1]
MALPKRRLSTVSQLFSAADLHEDQILDCNALAALLVQTGTANAANAVDLAAEILADLDVTHQGHVSARDFLNSAAQNLPHMVSAHTSQRSSRRSSATRGEARSTFLSRADSESSTSAHARLFSRRSSHGLLPPAPQPDAPPEVHAMDFDKRRAMWEIFLQAAHESQPNRISRADIYRLINDHSLLAAYGLSPSQTKHFEFAPIAVDDIFAQLGKSEEADLDFDCFCAAFASHFTVHGNVVSPDLLVRAEIRALVSANSSLQDQVLDMRKDLEQIAHQAETRELAIREQTDHLEDTYSQDVEDLQKENQVLRSENARLRQVLKGAVASSAALDQDMKNYNHRLSTLHDQYVHRLDHPLASPHGHDAFGRLRDWCRRSSNLFQDGHCDSAATHELLDELDAIEQDIGRCQYAGSPVFERQNSGRLPSISEGRVSEALPDQLERLAHDYRELQACSERDLRDLSARYSMELQELRHERDMLQEQLADLNGETMPAVAPSTETDMLAAAQANLDAVILERDKAQGDLHDAQQQICDLEEQLRSLQAVHQQVLADHTEEDRAALEQVEQLEALLQQARRELRENQEAHRREIDMLKLAHEHARRQLTDEWSRRIRELETQRAQQQRLAQSRPSSAATNLTASSSSTGVYGQVIILQKARVNLNALSTVAAQLQADVLDWQSTTRELMEQAIQKLEHRAALARSTDASALVWPAYGLDLLAELQREREARYRLERQLTQLDTEHRPRKNLTATFTDPVPKRAEPFDDSATQAVRMKSEDGNLNINLEQKDLALELQRDIERHATREGELLHQLANADDALSTAIASQPGTSRAPSMTSVPSLSQLSSARPSLSEAIVNSESRGALTQRLSRSSMAQQGEHIIELYNQLRESQGEVQALRAALQRMEQMGSQKQLHQQQHSPSRQRTGSLQKHQGSAQDIPNAVARVGEQVPQASRSEWTTVVTPTEWYVPQKTCAKGIITSHGSSAATIRLPSRALASAQEGEVEIQPTDAHSQRATSPLNDRPRVPGARSHPRDKTTAKPSQFNTSDSYVEPEWSSTLLRSDKRRLLDLIAELRAELHDARTRALHEQQRAVRLEDAMDRQHRRRTSKEAREQGTLPHFLQVNSSSRPLDWYALPPGSSQRFQSPVRKRSVSSDRLKAPGQPVRSLAERSSAANIYGACHSVGNVHRQPDAIGKSSQYEHAFDASTPRRAHTLSRLHKGELLTAEQLDFEGWDDASDGHGPIESPVSQTASSSASFVPGSSEGLMPQYPKHTLVQPRPSNTCR